MKIIGEGWDALKRLANIDLSLQHLEKSMDDIADELREMGRNVGDLQIRVVRLGTQREADRREREADMRELQAEISRFKAEAERLELRLSRQLPPPTDSN